MSRGACARCATCVHDRRWYGASLNGVPSQSSQRCATQLATALPREGAPNQGVSFCALGGCCSLREVLNPGGGGGDRRRGITWAWRASTHGWSGAARVLRRGLAPRRTSP